MVYIGDLDKAYLLKELWKHSKVNSYYTHIPELAPKLDEEILDASLLYSELPEHQGKKYVYVDHLCGRAIKVDFTANDVPHRGYVGYDEVNGMGAFRKIVNKVRRGG